MIGLDQQFYRIKDKMKPQWWCAFWGCVIAGFVMHMYPMTHHFLTYDSMWNQYSPQDMITSGRQFLTYACGISSFYDLPWLNGVLAIFYLAITSALLVEAFEMKDKVFATLTGVLTATFPALVSTFCYAYTIDGYMFAVLCSVAAYAVTRKYKWGFLPGILLVGVSLGIYQAYYSFTILLCILGLLSDILSEKKGKELVLPAFRFLGMGIGGYLFYFVTLKVMLAVKETGLSGYQGTDRILSMPLSELPKGIYMAVRMFGSFLLRANVLTGNIFMKISLVVLIAAAVGLYVALFIKAKAYKDMMKIIMTLLLLPLIPIGSTIVCVMAPDAFFHLLMRYPWVLFFIYVLVLAGEVQKVITKKKIADMLLWMVTAATVVMAFCFVVNGNIAYFNMNERYEKSYAYALRIADRLEAQPDYKMGDKVAVLGGFPKEEYYPSTDITQDVLKDYFGAGGDLVMNSTDKYATFMERYLNVTIVQASPQESDILILSPEFEEMPVFPKEGSIRKVEDIWIIKING